MSENQTLNKTAISLPVQGMTCASCVSHVQGALEKVGGVDNVVVNLATELATVNYDPNIVHVEALAKAIEEAGYEVESETISLSVGGMTCASCVAHVERALSGQPGVLNAAVNLATEKATVSYVPSLVGVSDLEKAIIDAGYEVVQAPQSETATDGTPELSREARNMQAARRRMLIAWAFTVPIILWMLPEMIAGIAWPSMQVYKIGMLVLALPVLFWAGRRTYVAAWRTTIHGAPNMDALIALGSGASLLTGIASLFAIIPSYAGVAAMIMAFHLTGRYIEASAMGRASEAIRRLIALGAKSARILVDGQEREVPIEQVQVGDVMLVRPGEQVPTDGTVVDGESAVDESMATGESMPVQRGPGDEVIGATINQDGWLKVEATRVGKDTFLAQVVRLVEQAQGTKVPIQAFADRITAVFVPVVMAVALLTFAAWMLFPEVMRPISIWASGFLPWINPNLGPFTLALITTVSVLVIACPCALGLATPTALMVGSGIGAENGILIRSGAAIQTMRDVGVIVFDKTGTLTRGQPAVTDVVPAPVERESGGKQMDVDALLRWAASVEVGSEHPLGKAVVRGATDRGLELGALTQFQAVRGKGVRGVVQSEDGSQVTVLVGSRTLLHEAGLSTTSAEDEMLRLEGQGKTVMLVAFESQVLGLVAVADTLKPDAPDAIAELHALGLETVMLTGDNRLTAEAIARQAGIDRVLAEVLPEDKLDEVRRLQVERESAGGQRFVAMVGDGINDAPALTQANVGIAIGTGTDIAIEAADITLVRGDLAGVIRAIKLSRATYNKVVQGLFWAFFYNVVMVPLAILGMMHPVLAEIAMAISSITVVTNANLLRRVDIRPQYTRT